MADVELENTAASEKCEKPVEEKAEKDVVEEKEEEAEEEAKPAEENGQKSPEKEKSVGKNGHTDAVSNGIEDKEADEEDKTSEPTPNGKEAVEDVCSIKRKSTGGDLNEEAATEVASPPKKAKLDDKTVAEVESNGSAAEVKA